MPTTCPRRYLPGARREGTEGEALAQRAFPEFVESVIHELSKFLLQYSDILFMPGVRDTYYLVGCLIPLCGEGLRESQVSKKHACWHLLEP